MKNLRRGLAALLSAALVISAFPFQAVAADIEAPLGGARTPGGTPIVSAPQLTIQGLPELPATEIPALSIEGRRLSAQTPSSEASVPGAAAASLLSASAQTAQANSAPAEAAKAAGATASIPAATGRVVASGAERSSSDAQTAFRPGVASRIAARLRDLSIWKSKSSGEVSGAASTALSSLGASSSSRLAGTGHEPAAPQAPQAPAPKKSWFGLGGAAALFIGALAVQQIGVESQAASMPALLQKVFGDFSVIADITIVASLGAITGRIIGPIIVNKFGIKKTYIGSLAAKLGISALMAGLLATAHITVPGLAVLYTINGFLGGVSMTAEKAIPPALLGQDQDKLELFGAGKQVVLETIGSVLPIATGAVVAAFGFMPALIAFPVAFGVSLALLMKYLKIPQKVEALRQAKLQADAAAGKKMGAVAQFGEFFKKIGHGAKVVWANPALKYAFLSFTAYMILNPFLYTVLAPAYGVLVAGVHASQQAAIYTMLTGLYSFGGLLGGGLILLEQRKIKKAKLPEAEVTEKLRKSMLRWMFLGTLGLGAIATLAIPIGPLFGSVTIPALALFFYGVAQVIANIKQENYFVSKVPEKDVNDAIGFMGAASLAASTLGLTGLKFLFTGKLPFGFHPFAFAGFHGFAPFFGIALAMIPTAMLYLWLTRKLDKASRDAAAPPAPPQTPPAPTAPQA